MNKKLKTAVISFIFTVAASATIVVFASQNTPSESQAAKTAVIAQEANFDKIKEGAVNFAAVQTDEEIAQARAAKIDQLTKDGRTDLLDEINPLGQYRSRGAMREAMDAGKADSSNDN